MCNPLPLKSPPHAPHPTHLQKQALTLYFFHSFIQIHLWTYYAAQCCASQCGDGSEQNKVPLLMEENRH